MISFVIPAHNEEAVIERCLNALLDGAAPGELDVTVVANGCTDHTAQCVRALGHPDVRVIETEVGSKVIALNLGDAAACGFPRFYMDADVVMSLDHVRRIATVLENGPILAACPRMRLDLSESSWAVRAYYAVWTRLPYVREGMMGVGVYALSRDGRQRFQQFPPVIADDGYVRLLFDDTERAAIADTWSLVTPPSTLSGLVKIKSRGRLGLYQLRAAFPDLFRREVKGKKYSSAVGIVAASPRLWLAAMSYLWVNMASRFRAKRQMSRLNSFVWERDETSRGRRGEVDEVQSVLLSGK